MLRTIPPFEFENWTDSVLGGSRIKPKSASK
jgi:hypothetical protein